MTEKFYDKIVRKFGKDVPEAKRFTDYPQGDPESIFEQKLLELSRSDKVALDLGCGDGRFTLRMAAHFQEIVGIDGSVERLKLAQAEQQAQRINNVRFEEQDAYQTTFDQDTFDLVYSRRGPTPYKECHRVIKPGGHFSTIGIGEKDAFEIKQVFGRGQGYSIWKESNLKQAEALLRQEGFEVVYAQNFLFDEYYASYQDLDLFLQGVPIFEDFDSEKDKKFLEAYVATSQAERGIRLPRHRIVIVAMKI